MAAFDIITEILLLVLPVHLIYGLQMRLSKKAMIIIAFSLRLPSVSPDKYAFHSASLSGALTFI